MGCRCTSGKTDGLCSLWPRKRQEAAYRHRAPSRLENIIYPCANHVVIKPGSSSESIISTFSTQLNENILFRSKTQSALACAKQIISRLIISPKRLVSNRRFYIAVIPPTLEIYRSEDLVGDKIIRVKISSVALPGIV